MIMPVETLNNQAEKLLFKLREAGPAGLTKGKLGLRAGKGGAARALLELIAERKVANLGTAARTCFVLIEHFNPLERACERIEKNALFEKPGREGAVDLLVRRDLEKGCEGEVRKKVDDAVDWLVKERRLIRFRRSRTIYFVHAEKLRGAAQATSPAEAVRPAPETPSAAGQLDRGAVLAAYQRLKNRLGTGNVEISELRREAACGMAGLKEFLIEESRRGRAVLSLGDWSVSSEETRAGAIDLFGKPHLLVRLDAE
jgi:hypothetical protein